MRYDHHVYIPLSGFTPLHYAYILQNVPVIHALKEAGANSIPGMLFQRKPEDYCCIPKDEYKSIVGCILGYLDKCLGVTSSMFRNPKEIRQSFEDLIPMQQRLFNAINTGDAREVKLLLPLIDINVKDPDSPCGNTTLHYVLIYQPKETITGDFIDRRVEILKLLLAKEPDLTTKGVCNFTPQQLLDKNKESRDKNVKKLALALSPIFEDYIEEQKIHPAATVHDVTNQEAGVANGLSI